MEVLLERKKSGTEGPSWQQQRSGQHRGINVAEIEGYSDWDLVFYLPVYIKNVCWHGGGCVIVKKNNGWEKLAWGLDDCMKSSVRKNHLGSNLKVAGELNDTCLWPTSKKALT